MRDVPVVLIAEDNPHDRLIAQKAFARAGRAVDVRFVETGESLLEYLEEAAVGAAACPNPRLVLLDLRMPRMDGRETLRRLRRDGRYVALPVIVLSTSDEPGDIADAYALGANSYLSKPVDFEQFVETIRALEHYWLDISKLPDLGA